MRTLLTITVALAFSFIAVLFALEGNKMPFEFKLIGECFFFNLAAYYLLTGLISKQGYSRRNAYEAIRLYFDGMLIMFGMMALISGMFFPQTTHPIWIGVGIALLIAGLWLQWRMMKVKPSPAHQYDWSRDLNDEEVWWYQFTTCTYIPLSLLTMFGMIGIFGSVFFLGANGIPNGPLFANTAMEDRTYWALPFFNLCATGMLAHFESSCLMNPYFSQAKQKHAT